MRSLVYVSTASAALDEPALLELLESARERNRDLDVTGMLLVHTGTVIQTLEGPDESVAQVFASIRVDPRHTGVLVVKQEQVLEREFPDWSMAFRNVSEVALTPMDGFSTFLSQDHGGWFGESSPAAYRMLELYAATLR